MWARTVFLVRVSIVRRFLPLQERETGAAALYMSSLETEYVGQSRMPSLSGTAIAATYTLLFALALFLEYGLNVPVFLPTN